MTFIQQRLNVDATSWRCIDIEVTLYKRPVTTGIALDKVLFFNQNMSIFFLFVLKNICCGYSLEMSQWGTSNEYPQDNYVFMGEKNPIYLVTLIIWS